MSSVIVRIAAGLFLAALLFNLLLVAAVQSTTYNGSFIAKDVWDTFIGYFGGLGALLGIGLFLGLLFVLFLVGDRVSRSGHHRMVGAIMVALFLITLLLGGLILWQLVGWDVLVQVLSVPFMWLLLFTAVQTAVFAAIAWQIIRGRRSIIRPAATTVTTTV